MPPNNTLTQLLQQGHVWRGADTPVQQSALNTGHGALNDALTHNGWPLGGLIEVDFALQQNSAEWFLLTPALQQLPGHIALLNPPAHPMALKLIQANIDLDRLWVIEANTRQDFTACWVELCHSSACQALIAWQPAQKFNYSDLRKCALACTHNTQLWSLLFRPTHAIRQSSPAMLKITYTLNPQHAELKIIKQKGGFTPNTTVQLPLPEQWQATAKQKPLVFANAGGAAYGNL